uniref:hypothetical protein n=1 Tax=Nocardioides sp. TaxID=35761 RepID=UPI00286E1D53
GAPSSTPTGLTGHSPARQDASFIGRAFPRNASARGRLVAGFPELLRPLRGSLIATSSVATDEQRLQAALVSTTADSPEQVLRGYRVRLSARGMQEQAAPAAAGSVAAAFVRGPSTITVTVTREGAWTSYSVYGALQAGKA